LQIQIPAQTLAVKAEFAFAADREGDREFLAQEPSLDEVFIDAALINSAMAAVVPPKAETHTPRRSF
jgi:hypothetical protein